MSKKTDEERAAYVLREFDSIPGREYRENFLAYQFGIVRYEASQAAAPAGPLTADECRHIAARMELENPVYAQPERIARDLRIWASRIDGTAPAWTGPQPVVDSLNGETS